MITERGGVEIAEKPHKVDIQQIIQKTVNSSKYSTAVQEIYQLDRPLIERWQNSGEYPTRQELNNLGLSEANWWLFNGISIPGGAGAPAEIVLPFWQSAVYRHLMGNHKKVLHIIAMMHGDEDPEYFKHWSGTRKIAAASIHAERSCGGSRGHSQNIRNQVEENISIFLANNSVHEGRIFVHPIEARLGTGLDNRGRLNIDYYYAENGVKNQKDLSEQKTEAHSFEELNEYLRHLMDHNGRNILHVTSCVDSRQGLGTLQGSESTFDEIKNYSNNSSLRNDWQGLGHTEHIGVALVDNDPVVAALLYDQLVHPHAIVRGRSSGSYMSPSRPFVLNIPSTVLTGKKGDWLRITLTRLISGMDTHVYRRSPATSIRSPISVFRRGDDGRVNEIDVPSGFQLYHPDDYSSNSFFRKITPGIAVDFLTVPVPRGPVIPFSKRRFGVPISSK